MSELSQWAKTQGIELGPGEMFYNCKTCQEATIHRFGTTRQGKISQHNQTIIDEYYCKKCGTKKTISHVEGYRDVGMMANA